MQRSVLEVDRLKAEVDFDVSLTLFANTFIQCGQINSRCVIPIVGRFLKSAQALEEVLM